MIVPSQTKPQSMETALRLPDIPELLTHLKLIDAIICLKTAIDIQGEAYGKEAGKAWDEFCQAAAVKFVEWSENVDASQKTIPIPPLDILMIWHSYMLNTKDYVQFQDKARRGEMAGKSFDWHELERKLELDYDGMSDILGSWDPSGQTQTPRLENLSPANDFDMVAAVQRQLKFAEKVHNAQWRHPEKINNFLDSAIGNYREFFTLIAENPGVGLAPTLAIDLVWHTHQLSPRRYRTYSRHMTNGRFVHHDDNLNEPALEEASHNAEKLYSAKYGVPYKRCAVVIKPEDPSLDEVQMLHDQGEVHMWS
ncbi:hypothetical protein INS49_013274 [Diaporthe citri]|uniref:uncharacterized protein n=1 Tax=Diaporthe citri TaxID=83186 RepID=UPI001C8085C7|nr:uncharacterized protein INS49_013274 [Diaporthe citri]KAG6357397.1 hypothetical protein INS49_013274 [Diaporthe citri]